MADYVLHLTQEENIVLGAGSVRRLIEGRNGDAALLYLSLARRGSSDPDRLRAELDWSARRFADAERALCSMGLISAPMHPAPPVAPPPGAPAQSEYTREDVTNKLEGDASFAAVLKEYERKLGRLSDPSVRRLLALYDFVGLPADVLLLLLNHCIERKAAQYGEGRLPTMKDIEKEGYFWARKELLSAAAADAYLRRARENRSRFGEYMEALGLGNRAASPGEEQYLGAWLDWGFPVESVALAYDKTVLKCHEFKWAYCNGILKKWHEKGLHTPGEIREKDKPPRRSAGAPNASGDCGGDAWMDEFIK